MRLVATSLFMLCGLAAGAVAQDTARPPVSPPRPAAPDSAARDTASIPREYLPPKGLCRIWISGVPAAQQPAPTDCPTALKNRPPNGRVVFSSDSAATAPGRSFRNVTRPPARPPARSSSRP